MPISIEDEKRLQGIREYLGVSAKTDSPIFIKEVVATSVAKLRTMHSLSKANTGEQFIFNIANHLKIKFEEVHTPEDVQRLTKEYLDKKELGLAQLPLELQNQDVDALLFKSLRQEGHYIAVLNLQNSDSRAYWNKSHEASHRLIEPPQRDLFHRHRTNERNQIEQIVDLVAAEVAFFEPIFKPIINLYSNLPLTWEIIHSIRSSFAPSASLIAVTKAAIKYWPLPVFLLDASYRGRTNKPYEDVALRASFKDGNQAALNSGVRFFTNMRVPSTSPMFVTHLTGGVRDDPELLSHWATSTESRLPSRRAFTSARPYQKAVLGLVNLL